MNFKSLSKGPEQANFVLLSNLCQKNSFFTSATLELTHCTPSLFLPSPLPNSWSFPNPFSPVVN